MSVSSFLASDETWVRLMARPAPFGRFTVTELVNDQAITLVATCDDWSSAMTVMTGRRAELTS
jgi:hypothetical protein